jgi:uroporphyrinogen III methyltransferase/synthase
VPVGLAAAAFAEIPITHRDQSSAVALVAGRPVDTGDRPALDPALAGFSGTLVFSEVDDQLGWWCAELIRLGRPPETPVAIVSRCSWPDQETVRCTLETVEVELSRREFRRPAVVIVGKVVALAPPHSWFTTRPLSGRRILLTRPVDQCGPLCDRLEELGADVLIRSAIEIADPSSWEAVDEALKSLDCFDCLVFSSANGVRYLLRRLREIGGDLRWFGSVRLAAIGPATAEQLGRYHLRADLVPTEYRAEALADALIVHCRAEATASLSEKGEDGSNAAGTRFLLVRASRGREVLAEQLEAAGGDVEQVVVYASRDVTVPDPEVAAALAAGRIDWVTVSSSAIARALVALYGVSLRNSRLVSISPITSETLRQLGYEPAVEAEHYTTDGMVEAMIDD